MADLACALPQRSVYFATTKEVTDRAVVKEKHRHTFKIRWTSVVFFKRRLFEFVYSALSPYCETERLFCWLTCVSA